MQDDNSQVNLSFAAGLRRLKAIMAITLNALCMAIQGSVFGGTHGSTVSRWSATAPTGHP